MDFSMPQLILTTLLMTKLTYPKTLDIAMQILKTGSLFIRDIVEELNKWSPITTSKTLKKNSK